MQVWLVEYAYASQQGLLNSTSNGKIQRNVARKKKETLKTLLPAFLSGLQVHKNRLPFARLFLSQTASLQHKTVKIPTTSPNSARQPQRTSGRSVRALSKILPTTKTRPITNVKQKNRQPAFICEKSSMNSNVRPSVRVEVKKRYGGQPAGLEVIEKSIDTHKNSPNSKLFCEKLCIISESQAQQQ